MRFPCFAVIQAKDRNIFKIPIISCGRQGGMGMERKLQKDSWVMWVLKSLLVSYVITGILLLLLAVALFKFELNEKAVSAGCHRGNLYHGDAAWRHHYREIC